MNWRSSTATFRIKTFTIALLILIAIGSFAYTQYLIVKITNNERSSIELWAKALEYTSTEQNVSIRLQLQELIDEIQETPLLIEDTRLRWISLLDRVDSELSNAGVHFVASELIINNRFDIPSVLVNEEREIVQYVNLDEKDIGEDIIKQFASINDPININLAGNETQLVYYGYSAIVRTLQFFPYIQFGLLALFLGLAYASLSSIKKNEQSRLWVGMARESAHQLGTPISSLMGWLAILKDTTYDENTLNVIHEFEKDIHRLESVAERFNKIGSEPELKEMRVGPVLREVSDYMQRRIPQLGGNLKFHSHIEMDAKADINAELFKWAIENLIKNAIDALQEGPGEHYVKVTSELSSKGVIIDVKDDGKGMEKRKFNEIFSPGYSTKKRGWGLGLSLTKRIIEEYHKGSVFVHKSEINKGTTFRIVLPAKEKGHLVLQED